MKWLVSCQIEPNLRGDRGVSRHTPYDVIQVWDLEPAAVIYKNIKDLANLEELEYDSSMGILQVDRIVRIYFVKEYSDIPSDMEESINGRGY